MSKKTWLLLIGGGLLVLTLALQSKEKSDRERAEWIRQNKSAIDQSINQILTQQRESDAECVRLGECEVTHTDEAPVDPDDSADVRTR